MISFINSANSKKIMSISFALLRPPLFLSTQQRKQQEGPTPAAALSHLLDLLDLRVVVARRDLWVGLDLLIVFEQSSDLRSGRNQTLPLMCGCVVA